MRFMVYWLQLANYLRGQGVKKGDAVAIYMPMLAELPIAMLACARIGAVHSVSSNVQDLSIFAYKVESS